MARFSPRSGTASAMVAIARSLRNDGRILVRALRGLRFEQRLGELEGDSRAAEVFAGVDTICAVRIEHGKRGRQASGFIGQVMVGDDEVDAESCGGLGRGKGANAGVDADDQTRSGGCRGFDHFALHSVAFAEAVGDVEADIAA